MSSDKILQETRQIIGRDLEWEDSAEVHSEEELVELLSRHVAFLLDRRTEYLFSVMYRLDVSEKKVRKALDGGMAEAPAYALARLLVERQKQRLATRRAYRPDDLGEDAW